MREKIDKIFAPHGLFHKFTDMKINPSTSVIYELNIRQATEQGTFRAAEKRLGKLREIGVDVIWLMPVYPIGRIGRKGSLGSYYSVADYTAVNPEFGTMDDFDAFVSEAHRLGMAVILDWVANHTARDARWLIEKPYDWYEREYDGSARIPCDWSDAAKLNYANRDVWKGESDAMGFWIEKHGVDGFRCDMAMLVPLRFWVETRRELEKTLPGIFMLAEAEGKEFVDEAFDSCYSWKIYHTLNDIAVQKTRVWDLRARVCEFIDSYPERGYLLNFTSNHDENSWSGNQFRRMGDAVRTMAALTFLLPGTVPLIYTGQEYGYDHDFAFFDRDPMPEMEDNSWTDLYRTLCGLRHTVPSMSSKRDEVSYGEIATNAPDCLYFCVRNCQNSTTVGCFNLSPYPIKCDFATDRFAGLYRNALTGVQRELRPYEDGVMAPWEFEILVKE